MIIIGTHRRDGRLADLYAVGRRGGRHLLERYGKWVLISHSDLDRAERFFAGRGSWAVAVARVLPLVRCFASFGAGVVEVPMLPFAIFSLIGTAVWTTALTLLGYNLGSTVDKFFKTFSVAGIILVVVLLGALIAHRVHAIRKDAHRRAEAAAAAGTASASGPSADADPPGQPGSARATAPVRPGGAHRTGRPQRPDHARPRKPRTPAADFRRQAPGSRLPAAGGRRRRRPARRARASPASRSAPGRPAGVAAA